jgi:hypothetical protein
MTDKEGFFIEEILLNSVKKLLFGPVGQKSNQSVRGYIFPKKSQIFHFTIAQI